MSRASPRPRSGDRSKAVMVGVMELSCSWLNVSRTIEFDLSRQEQPNMLTLPYRATPHSPRIGILRTLRHGDCTMKRLRIWVILLSGILLTVGGSTLAEPQTVSVEPGTGLAFGSFDITQSDLAVTHVVLMRVKPARMYMGSSGEKRTITYTNGEFFSPNLAPGLYSVMGFFSGNKFFALERGLRDNTFEVAPGRVTYAGSYKLELTKGGLFRQDKGT